MDAENLGGWTPEPWSAGPIDQQQAHVDARGGDQDLRYGQWGEMVTCWGSDDFPTQGMDKAIANRDRIVACINACTGAPASIQPGAVVAMAEALTSARDLASQVAKKSGLTYSEAEGVLQEIDAALALYNGTGVVDEYY